jgi:hypothetical protein
VLAATFLDSADAHCEIPDGRDYQTYRQQRHDERSGGERYQLDHGFSHELILHPVHNLS